jgi:hypothetical protein
MKPEIRKLCVVRTFVDIEELVRVATKVEKVLGELGEIPYEPLREEQEEETSESNVEKQVTPLSNTLINFFKGNAQNPAYHHPLALCLEDARSVEEGTIWPLLVRG